MEGQDLSPTSCHVEASRPSIGFPLGTALLLIVLFSLSGVFSCCYHWDKLRSLRRSSYSGDDDTNSDEENDPEQPPLNPKPACTDWKTNYQSQTMPVLMPGDVVPKFIALPSPTEPPRDDKFVPTTVDKPIPKPPRIAIPMYI